MVDESIHTWNMLIIIVSQTSQGGFIAGSTRSGHGTHTEEHLVSSISTGNKSQTVAGYNKFIDPKPVD